MANIRYFLLKHLKKWQIIITVLFLIQVNASLATNSQLSKVNHSELITLNFYQTDIGIILQALADSKQLNMIMTEDVAQKQTIKLQNVDWHKALMIIINSANLQAKIDDNILFISKAEDPEQINQKQRLDKLSLEQRLPLNTLPIRIQHADLNTLLDTIHKQTLLSERGKIIVDKRTNSLIITDIPPKLTAIKSLITLLDKSVPQVHISAHIVNMSDESMSELGIKWGYLGQPSQLINKFDVKLGAANSTANLGFNLAKISGSLLNLELSALQAENQLEIIASPNLLTANQNMASIKQGTEIPYEVSSGSNGSTSIEFKQAVLGLEVTPKIIGEERMILDLHITQNTAGQAIKRSDGGEALAIDTQEIKTQVKVKSGETIVLGGIFHQINSKNDHHVPYVSQLPIIGSLFKYKNKKQQKRELVIFITPQLVE